MEPLRIKLLQHVPFEGPGNLAGWAGERGHRLELVPLYGGAALPAPDTFDWLIVMGGPMGVSDEQDHPWLSGEKCLLLEALAAGRRVVGVCLGAQLIASVLGAEVYANGEKEIGWFPISAAPGGEAEPLKEALSGAGPVFHWHGDTFTLPPGALQLASSEACRNQAFLYKTQALALQCHLEMDADSLEGMLRHGAGEITAGGSFVQSAAEMRARPEALAENAQRLFRLMDAFAALP